MMELVVFIGFVFDRLETVIYVVFFSQMGRTSVFFLNVFKSFALEAMGDSLVSDGGCKQYTEHRTCHTRKHFLACGSCRAHASQSALFCVISGKSHLHRHISCRTLHDHGLTAFLFHLRTAADMEGGHRCRRLGSTGERNAEEHVSRTKNT